MGATVLTLAFELYETASYLNWKCRQRDNTT